MKATLIGAVTKEGFMTKKLKSLLKVFTIATLIISGAIGGALWYQENKDSSLFVAEDGYVYLYMGTPYTKKNWVKSRSMVIRFPGPDNLHRWTVVTAEGWDEMLAKRKAKKEWYDD